MQTTLPDSDVIVWLVDSKLAFDRPGNPYLGADGHEWPDNAFRFALYCQVVVDMALNRLAFDWPVDLVHCNDWQTGLVPALLSRFEHHPPSVFTIHNLAYQGLYPPQTYFGLGLPGDLWSIDGLEYHGLFSFIKGGIVFADRVNAVSPTYAHEITTEAFGYGLQGLLMHRGTDLSGILNGIDANVWNPATDPNLTARYDAASLDQKAINKQELQARFGLTERPDSLLIGMISRLVEQKGLDLIFAALPELLDLPVQFFFLGSGAIHYEQALQAIAAQHPDSVAVYIGYDEALSHQVEASCDLYLMPSMFEPCGLNQFYSLRYGTLPLVSPVGGLADSVTDVSRDSGAGNGFMMADFSTQALVDTVQRALSVWQQPELWRQLQVHAMAADHSWQHSAEEYRALYRQVVSG